MQGPHVSVIPISLGGSYFLQLVCTGHQHSTFKPQTKNDISMENEQLKPTDPKFSPLLTKGNLFYRVYEQSGEKN